MSGRAGIIEYGIDRFNDYCRTLVQRTTDAWERYVTRQARWVDFADDYKTMDLSYMESVMWAFKAPVGQGPALRGRAGPALLLGVRDPAVELRDPPGRRLPTPGRTRPSRWPSPSTPTPPRRSPPAGRRAAAAARVDDDPVDAAVEPGPRRRARHRPTPSTSSWAQPTAIAADRAGGLPRAPRRRRAPGPVTGAAAGRAHLPAPLRLLRRPRRRLPGARPATSWPPTRAPASSTWPRASARRTTTSARRPASPWSARSTTGPASPPRSRPTPGSSSCSTPTRPSPPTSRPAGALVEAKPYTHSYPHCWRTDTPLIYKAVSSWFVKVTAIKDRMLELNQRDRLGPGPRPRRRLRQVARGGPRLVHQPQPLLGRTHPGVEERRPPLPPHRRLRQPRRARARLRRAPRRPAPPRHRRARPAQSRRPHGRARPCAG